MTRSELDQHVADAIDNAPHLDLGCPEDAHAARRKEVEDALI